MNRNPYGLAFVFLVSFVLALAWAGAQEPDETTRLLQEYVRIDTSNPPGDTRKAADFLAGGLEREGIPVTRYESEPGKAIVIARLKATVSPPAGKAIVLLHHMDVVPADRSQWKIEPFNPTIQGDDLWGRGALDMKGQGVAQLVAFLTLKRQRVLLNRDVILLAESDEEVGGAVGDREPLRRARSGVRDRRGRFRQPRPVRARQARVRDRGGRKEDRLAQGARRRRGRPWQPAARSEPERSPGESAPAVACAAAAVGRFHRAQHDEVARGLVRRQQVHQRDSAFDDRAHLDAIGRR